MHMTSTASARGYSMTSLCKDSNTPYVAPHITRVKGSLSLFHGLPSAGSKGRAGSGKSGKTAPAPAPDQGFRAFAESYDSEQGLARRSVSFLSLGVNMPPSIEPNAVRRSSLWVGILLAILAAWFAYEAYTCEITGKARYPGGRGSRTVTRESSPAEFRHGKHSLWAASAFCFAIAVGSFAFYRKLGSYA